MGGLIEDATEAITVTEQLTGRKLDPFEKSFFTTNFDMEDVDCVIVGAGISGLITARRLADAGVSTMVFDKDGQLAGVSQLVVSASPT